MTYPCILAIILKPKNSLAVIRHVVVSAKDLTDIDRKRLKGNIEAIYQKGSLPPRTFVDQVVEVLEHKMVDGHSPVTSNKEEDTNAS